ncbi:E3 ubiquitin-protein ligase AIRP2 [Linum grandiflorum]
MVKSSFKDSLKALEADIQHANTLALDYPRENDGARMQMRLSYSPAAQFFMFLVQWTDCHLAGAFGLLRILIYMTYDDGKTTMSVYERRASLKEFYGVIFPSLLQLQRGITELEDRKQIEVCSSKYTRDAEREEECGICMEMNPKFVLPDCNHSMCLKCFRDWRGRSELCPFCRDSLKRTNSGDLWIYTDSSEIVDLPFISRENCRRLFMYIDKLPLIVPDHLYSM